ncbi:MAG: UDP-N-acetylglucosamine--N-acetylmuramyl-(pentapeptide) pyrophosphoryl-undecaprenol N-acetylglucosamine transferase [Pirellulales bacterium]|nr:UDP-N-acetylglucosamine--N-acetylmuramyl-(pentapeptide) pyrophosphoryl-undecaprenol N-acetylglucosamine transferase [Pirellulales bacterium]
MAVGPHILFAGGGTAGYLHPGIAVAAHLAKAIPEARITFAGPGHAREKHTVRTAGYHYAIIPSQPVPQNPIQALRFVTDNVAGYCAAHWMLGEQRASLVVGLGGFASTAVVWAAQSRGVPFVLLEQNALPSRTTRWFAREAALVFAAFDEVRPHLHVQASVKVTGNPARPAFEDLFHRTCANGKGHIAKGEALADAANSRPKRLVVLGGAGGARSLNDSVPRALKKIGNSLSGWQVIHQTGEGQLQETENRSRKCGIEALAVSFIDEIASLLFASDLVVCRSGGTCLAELALAGVPAVLVPNSHANDDHHLANAKVFAAARACCLIDESSQSGALDTALANELQPLMADDPARLDMTDKIRQLARPQASSEIASVIRETLFGNQSRLLAA